MITVFFITFGVCILAGLIEEKNPKLFNTLIAARFAAIVLYIVSMLFFVKGTAEVQTKQFSEGEKASITEMLFVPCGQPVYSIE